MIALLKNLVPSNNSVRYRKEWNYENFIGQELSSLTIGIIGFGRLGKIMSKFCHAFGMKVLIYDKYKVSRKYKNVNLKYLSKNSDVISLHIHLNQDTYRMIDKNFLKHCSRKPIIINTSRGDIVDESQILRFLKNKNISGYGTDVISHELSSIKKSPLLNNTKKYNILITPHIGGMTVQGQKKAYEWAASKFL